jgi:hypothetical protein
LTDAGYEITGCKWYKNGIEVTGTYTANVFSFAEPADKLLETAPTYYMFKLVTKNHGELNSTEKIIIKYDKAISCAEVGNLGNLLVYPNPVWSGSLLSIEGLAKGSLVYVYNHLGACVHTIIAKDNMITIPINLPQGIYLIRNEEKIGKVMVVK